MNRLFSSIKAPIANIFGCCFRKPVVAETVHRNSLYAERNSLYAERNSLYAVHDYVSYTLCSIVARSFEHDMLPLAPSKDPQLLIPVGFIDVASSLLCPVWNDIICPVSRGRNVHLLIADFLSLHYDCIQDTASCAAFVDYFLCMIDWSPPSSAGDLVPLDAELHFLVVALLVCKDLVTFAGTHLKALDALSDEYMSMYIMEHLMGHSYATSAMRASAPDLLSPIGSRSIALANSKSMYHLNYGKEFVCMDTPDSSNHCPHAYFREETSSLLDGVLSPNLVCAGGAPLASLLGGSIKDVDIFLVGFTDASSAIVAISRAAEQIMVNAQRAFHEPTFRFFKTENAYNVSVYSDNIRVDIQFVLRLFADEAQIPLSFDLGPTRITYDGTVFRSCYTADFALAYRVCIPDPLRATTSQRMPKYHFKGFRATLVAEGTDVTHFDALWMSFSRMDNDELLDASCLTRVETILRDREIYIRQLKRSIRRRARVEVDTFSGGDPPAARTEPFGVGQSMVVLVTLSYMCNRKILLFKNKNYAKLHKQLEESKMDPTARLMEPQVWT
jgi:hypothetical protein